MKTVIIIIGIVIVAVVLVIVWAYCTVAGEVDDRMGEE